MSMKTIKPKFIDEFKHDLSNLGNKSNDIIISDDTNIDLLMITIMITIYLLY